MSLPGMNDDGTAKIKKSSDYDYIARDILGPPKVVRRGGNKWTAVVLQLVFGYVGAGYFYLGDRRRAVYSAFSFIAGVVIILLLEMLIFPSDTVVNYSLMPLQYVAYALFFMVAAVYFVSVYDCYRIGVRSGRRGGTEDSLIVGEPTHEEKLERVLSEHDRKHFVEERLD